MTRKSKKKIGLALGGGGARGCAHIGVIKALEEAGIFVDCIAGTSIGALVGGIYAMGNLKKLEDYLLTVEWKDVVRNLDPVLPKQGLFKGEKVCKLLEKILSAHSFADTRIPFSAVATDLFSGREICIEKGNLVQAIHASIAIPGIFNPVKKGARYLVDGGVVNPLPVNILQKKGADIIIAVDLNYQFLGEKKKSVRSYSDLSKNRWSEWLTPSHPHIIDVIESTIFTMQSEVTEKNLLACKPDFLIRPTLHSAGIFDFDQAEKLIKAGYKAMKAEIPKLAKLIAD